MENIAGKKVYSVLILILVAIAFALGYYTFAYRQGNLAQKERQSVPASETLALEAIPVRTGNIPFTKNYVGYVTHIHEAKIQPFINGFIDRILVKGGEFVRKGDLLVVLEQSQYRAELAAAYADILKAEANLKNAQVYYDRIQKAGVKAVSPTELDNAQAQFLAAKASFEQARANYALAEVNYGYTIIRSPIDGLIGDVPLTKGNYVSPASGPLFSVMQYNPIRVVFSITDKEYLAELSKIRPFAGDEITLQLAGGQIFPNRGIFRYSDNAVNKATNSIAVYFDFANIGKMLAPNAYVTVLVKKHFADALSVPKSVVQLEENGSYTNVIRGNKLIKLPVKILASDGSKFILGNNFQPGDYLVTERVQESYYKKGVAPKVLPQTQAHQPLQNGLDAQRGNEETSQYGRTRQADGNQRNVVQNVQPHQADGNQKEGIQNTLSRLPEQNRTDRVQNVQPHRSNQVQSNGDRGDLSSLPSALQPNQNNRALPSEPRRPQPETLAGPEAIIFYVPATPDLPQTSYSQPETGR